MPNANGQHTDAENSKPMRTASNAGDDLRQISSKSAQKIAQEDKALAGKGGTEDAVTAPLAAGSL